jgi:hypothetical protein
VSVLVEHLLGVLEQAPELVPFLVGVAVADLESEVLEAPEDRDLSLQLGDRARRRLIDDLLSASSTSPSGAVEVVDVVAEDRGLVVGTPGPGEQFILVRRFRAPRRRSGLEDGLG